MYRLRDENIEKMDSTEMEGLIRDIEWDIKHRFPRYSKDTIQYAKEQIKKARKIIDKRKMT